MSINNLIPQRWVSPLIPRNIPTSIRIIEKLSEEKIKKDRRLIKIREGWIASLYLLARTSKEGKPWYLRKNEIENSVDDIYCSCFYESDGKYYSDGIFSMQTFVINEFGGTIIECIKKKLKYDLRNVILTGLITRDEIIDWNEIIKELNKEKTTAKEISLIGRVDPNIFQVTQIFPSFSYHQVNPTTFNWKYKNIIEGKWVLNPKDSGVSYVGKVLIKPDLSVVDL